MSDTLNSIASLDSAWFALAREVTLNGVTAKALVHASAFKARAELAVKRENDGKKMRNIDLKSLTYGRQAHDLVNAAGFSSYRAQLRNSARVAGFNATATSIVEATA